MKSQGGGHQSLWLSFGALGLSPDEGVICGISMPGSGLGAGLVETGIDVHFFLSLLLGPRLAPVQLFCCFPLADFRSQAQGYVSGSHIVVVGISLTFWPGITNNKAGILASYLLCLFLNLFTMQKEKNGCSWVAHGSDPQRDNSQNSTLWVYPESRSRNSLEKLTFSRRLESVLCEMMWTTSHILFAFISGCFCRRLVMSQLCLVHGEF